jgi:hypothetical protein
MVMMAQGLTINPPAAFEVLCRLIHALGKIKKHHRAWKIFFTSIKIQQACQLPETTFVLFVAETYFGLSFNTEGRRISLK